MLAVISDIHGNTEALRAVLADIESRGIKQILCLGDVVGYGPEPNECLDLVRQAAAVTLMGNHDYAVMFEPTQFNVSAESASFWTRAEIESEPDPQKRGARWAFLGSLPVKYTTSGEGLGMGELMFVHGSPRRPINEYIFPDDVYNAPNKVQGSLDRTGHLCFVGHTHVPGVFIDPPDFYSPDELEGVFEVNTQRKAIINVGSVGQPRDRDNRASYVVVEPGRVRFVRVPYDVTAVMEKVRRIEQLDNYLGQRLVEGR
ncbi:MAG: metallophosphoesterase family protein [Planctomycetes bacterium]|nr:metallophosphoesterase family protein [Planctomycetota bacterium]